MSFSQQINWLISKAQRRTLDDGTVTYHFQGTLPARMARQIKRQTKGWTLHKRQGRYIEGETFTATIRWGETQRTQYNVRFTLNDYTVPMGR